MRFAFRLSLLSFLFASALCHASTSVFFEGLYWQATETVDWALNNNLSNTNQRVAYLTSEFKFKPGFRLGIEHQKQWYSSLYYTHYTTSTEASSAGNLTSAFIGGKLAQSNPDFFFRTGALSTKIRLNILDLDFGKEFHPLSSLRVLPILGLEGGSINQNFDTRFQGQKDVAEYIKHDFTGLGPKVGIKGGVILQQQNNYSFELLADFSTTFLWGRWKIHDKLYASSQDILITDLAQHNMGALSVHSGIGAGLNYGHLSIKLLYELNDWINQCQIFDDATGPHKNDLVLQGISIGISYRP